VSFEDGIEKNPNPEIEIHDGTHSKNSISRFGRKSMTI
jgi:hypothetical protein